MLKACRAQADILNTYKKPKSVWSGYWGYLRVLIRVCHAQADILNRYRRRVLGTGSLFALRHYHRPLAHAAVPTSYTFSPVRYVGKVGLLACHCRGS